jgi:predicted transcriptional regulator
LLFVALRRRREKASDTSMTKEQILRAIEELPEDATVEDAMERLYLLLKIERGIAQADAGEVISHDSALDLVKRWVE